ncbi:glycosyltransferase family 2 protein [Flavobacterium sp. WC2416]|uniref:Glycosyltransferase family 2 protein n=1 Tax=Flavobacterium sp. WC2416 TaxID=3234141 RepID=A0AB39WCF6_9FLAO
MQASIVIVSKNRKEELEKTLLILEKLIDFSIHEVLVFLDGCSDASELLITQFKWVIWEKSEKSIGASGARNSLYPKATGEYLIGLDDDAHPLQSNFIALTKTIFEDNPTAGVLAFQEIKGIFNSDTEALAQKKIIVDEFYCNEFVGCGFAIKNEVYKATNGFPVWVDIYGEEPCVSIEVIAKGFDILYTNRIAVNHRVNMELRKKSGANYFRFGKQLKNATYYYLVYYPFPILKIVLLFWHNFKKYATKDWSYFKIYFQTIIIIALYLPQLIKFRNPVDAKVLKKMKELSCPKF